MKVISVPFLSNKALVIIGLTSLLVGGCSESTTDSKDDAPPTAANETFPAHAWKQHYDEAGELFQAHKYHDMVRILEQTKAQAKQENGETIVWGKYLTRLAKAHSWAVEYPAASRNAVEAVKLFDKLNAPAVDKFAANWFAGISLANSKDYEGAIPYLKKAQELSKDPSSGVGSSLAFLYQNLEECYKQTKNTAALAAVSKEKRARLH